MKKIIALATLTLLMTPLAEAKQRMPDGSKIKSGTDTVVLASNKIAKDFYRDLKQRAVQKNFYFLSTDDDTRSFATEFYDVTTRASVQLKVYVKDVPGGSNAVVTGVYKDLKKLKKYPYYRSRPIIYRGKGKGGRHAWDALYKFAAASKKWKHTFLKR